MPSFPMGRDYSRRSAADLNVFTSPSPSSTAKRKPDQSRSSERPEGVLSLNLPRRGAPSSLRFLRDDFDFYHAYLHGGEEMTAALEDLVQLVTADLGEAAGRGMRAQDLSARYQGGHPGDANPHPDRHGAPHP